MLPLRAPLALVASLEDEEIVTAGLTPATALADVVITFWPGSLPSIETLMAPTASLAPNPVPVTLMAVPFGPEVLPKVAIGAAAANEMSGAAIAMISSIVRTAAVVLLNEFNLFICIFFS
jgi:hypothetical protein